MEVGLLLLLSTSDPWVVIGPYGQALGPDSWSDKGADMREKGRGDNYSHLGEEALSDSTIAIT